MKLTDDLEIILKAHTKGYEDGYSRATIATKKLKTEQEKQRPLNEKLADSFSKAGTQAGIFLGPLNALSGRLTTMGVALNRINPSMLAVGVSFGSLIALTKSAILQFAQWEEQLLRQQALLNATGYAAGLTGTQLEEMAQRNARATLASVDEMRNAIGILTTFKSVSGQTFERTIQLAQDMASTFQNVSLTSATTQLAKALEDPQRGLTALTRTGVTFSEQQREQILLFAEQGDMAQAHKLILEQVAGQMSGASSAAAAGLKGKYDSLTQSYENFLNVFEKKTAGGNIGGAIIDTFTTGLENITADWENSLEHQAATVIAQRERIKSSIEANPILASYLSSDLAELEAEYQRITDLQVEAGRKRVAEEEAARAKGEITQKQLLADRKEAELKAAREKSIASLDVLETQLANEQDKINVAWERRYSKIDQLYLTQEDAEKRGFASVEALKDSLRDQADTKFNQGFASLEEKHQRELEAVRRQQERIAREKQRAIDKEAREVAKQAKAAQRLKTEQEREKVRAARQAAQELRAAQKLDRDVASIESYYATEQQRLDIDHQQRLNKLESLKLKELGMTEKYEALKAGIEKKYSQEKTATQYGQMGELGQAVAQFADFETQSSREKFETGINLGKTYFGQMGQQSKKAFAIQKAFSIAQAVMNTYQMATSAYSAMASIPYVGPVLGAGAAAAAIAFGLAQISQIRKQSSPSGQFHQGIDYVPETGNYTLLKGERVVDDRLNKDLKTYMAKPEAAAPSVNFNLQQLDTNGMENMIRENMGVVYDVVREVYEDQGRTF